MLEARLLMVLATATVVPFCSLLAQEEEPNPDINVLGEYLGEMSEKLNCYFTFEDRPDAQGAMPWLVYIDQGFVPDLNVATIDALVTKLNQELPTVKFQRSTIYPSVVHVIAKDLLGEGYVMEQQITAEYSGLLNGLPDHMGTLLDGKLHSASGGSIPVRIEPDVTTEVQVNVQNKSVRDILTGAAPLIPARRFLWESQRVVINGATKFEVRCYAADEEEGGGEE